MWVHLLKVRKDALNEILLLILLPVYDASHTRPFRISVEEVKTMAIPPYQTIMLPLLRIARDGQEHTATEAIEALARQFHLSEQDRKELLPSGTQQKFNNRVGWARTYLTKAGLLETTGRARFRITPRGREVLSTGVDHIDNQFLRQFPEFRDFARVHEEDVAGQVSNRVELSQTPEESLETIYQELRRELANDLLTRIKSSSPRFFENLVVDLLVAMGYGGSRKDAGQAVGQSGDGGIDGIIKEDKLGLDVVYIQAKRWEGPVGRPVVQGFAGSLAGHQANKGVLITTSHFTQDAKEYVSRIGMKIVLVDGEQLAQFMIDHGLGVAEVATYTLKKVDLDYFSSEV
jgi:restriction system protein